MNDRIIQILLGLMVTTFLAWAGVVWSTGQEILNLVRDIHADVRKLEVKQTAHADTKWAHGVQDHVVDSARMMDVTRSRLERLEKDHEEAIRGR